MSDLIKFIVVVIIAICVSVWFMPAKSSPIYLNSVDDDYNSWADDNIYGFSDSITLKKAHANHHLIIGNDALSDSPIVMLPKASTMNDGDQITMTAELKTNSDYFYVAEVEGSFDSPYINYMAPYLETNTEGILVLTVGRIDGAKAWIVSGGQEDHGAYTL